MSRVHFLLEFLLAGVRALPASQRLYQAVAGGQADGCHCPLGVVWVGLHWTHGPQT